MTKKITVKPIVKVIGSREYLVESIFMEDAKMNLTGKILKLMDHDLKSRTDPLLSEDSKVTSHNPSGGVTENHGGKES